MDPPPSRKRRFQPRARTALLPALATACIVAGGWMLVRSGTAMVGERSGAHPGDDMSVWVDVRKTLDMYEGRNVFIDGYPRLLVGDVMGRNWPRSEFDGVVFGDVDVAEVVYHAGRALSSPTHSEVVIWLGTEHLMRRREVDALLTQLAALVDEVGGRPFVIIGPLCPVDADDGMRARFAEANAYLDATYPHAYLDAAALLQIPGPGSYYVRDRVRIRPEGYAVIQNATVRRLADSALALPPH